MRDTALRETRYQLETALRALQVALSASSDNSEFSINIRAKIIKAIEVTEIAQYHAWQGQVSGFILPGYQQEPRT